MKFDLHVHSNCSDGRDEVRTILQAAVRRGLAGLSITDHDTLQGSLKAMKIIREERLDLILIPGAEVTTAEGHLLVLGVQELPPRGRSPEETTEMAREQGGITIVPHPYHPFRHAIGRIPDCDAVEVLNGKVDGTVAPNLALLRHLRRHRGAGGRVHAIFGLDLHDLEQPRDVWIECQPSALTATDIVQSLREGRYLSRVINGAVPSSGKVPLLEFISLAALRCAYLGWNSVRAALPRRLQTGFVELSRPFVRMIKRGGHRA